MRTIRNKKRLTQKELGCLTRISQNYISQIEHGNIRGLTMSKLIDIATVLDVSPETLLSKLLNN